MAPTTNSARRGRMFRRTWILTPLLGSCLVLYTGTAEAVSDPSVTTTSVWNITGWIPVSELTKCSTPQGDPWKVDISNSFNGFTGWVTESVSFTKPSTGCAERYQSTRVSIVDASPIFGTISTAGTTSATQGVLYGTIPQVNTTVDTAIAARFARITFEIATTATDGVTDCAYSVWNGQPATAPIEIAAYEATGAAC